MQEPIVLRCQCRPRCDLWITLDPNDIDLLDDQDLRIIHPAHSNSPDRIYRVRRGYTVTGQHPDKRSGLKTGVLA